MGRTTTLLTWMYGLGALAGCDASCGGAADRKAMGQAMSAHDCPPDVAVCVGGETFLSIGQAQAPGEPCRQLSLGACERGCVDEGVPVAYVGVSHERIRAQLCEPPRGEPPLTPVAPGVCPAGEVLCKDGVVQICGKQAARCEHGCATDDVISGELELTLEQAARLLCAR